MLHRTAEAGEGCAKYDRLRRPHGGTRTPLTRQTSPKGPRPRRREPIAGIDAAVLGRPAVPGQAAPSTRGRRNARVADEVHFTGHARNRLGRRRRGAPPPVIEAEVLAAFYRTGPGGGQHPRATQPLEAARPGLAPHHLPAQAWPTRDHHGPCQRSEAHVTPPCPVLLAHASVRRTMRARTFRGNQSSSAFSVQVSVQDVSGASGLNGAPLPLRPGAAAPLHARLLDRPAHPAPPPRAPPASPPSRADRHTGSRPS